MRVLVAEHDPRQQRELLELLRSWQFDAEGFSDGRAAWEALEQPGGPRLAIWDAALPGVDGREAARRARSADAPRYVYLLLLAERLSGQPPALAVEDGADDCLFLPINAEELRLRLQVARRRLHREERLLALEEAVRQQAERDPLTRVWNRRAVAELLERELHRARREDDWVAVLALDLDGFKRINEQRGEAAGDQLLRLAVERLRSSVRASDWLGRSVAAKFFLVLPGCNPDRSIATAERLRRAISSRAFELETGAAELTASVGLAIDRGGSLAAPELIERANAELERARVEGGDLLRHAPPTGSGQLPLA